MSVAFGDKLSLLWVSDLHAAPDLDAYNAYQAALLDSDNALTLIDANTDPEGGPIHELENEALTDPGIFAKRIEYTNFEEYCEKAPHWIDRDKARQLQKTQLPAAFERDILGKRGSGKYALFPGRRDSGMPGQLSVPRRRPPGDCTGPRVRCDRGPGSQQDDLDRRQPPFGP